MNEFLQNLTGGITAGKFAASFFFTLIGIFLSLMLSTTTRDPSSKRTPFCFSWDFFWSDNAKRIAKSVALTLLVIFVSIRFAKELLGMELTMIFSFGVGLGLDRIKEVLKNKSKLPFDTNTPKT